MTTNIEIFELNLKKYAEETIPERARDQCIAVGLEATRGVTMLTPVDQGFAKGGWQFTVGSPASGPNDRVDQSPEGTESQVVLTEALEAMRAFRLGEMLWLSNVVPYINFLNDGTERMSAFAMVPRTKARLERTFG
jgi:hypothetical protein